MSVRTLTDEDLALIATVVAENSAANPLPQLLTVEDAAARLAMSENWIYEHSADLGGVRLGSGRRRALRFPAPKIAAYIAQGAEAS